MEPRGTGVGVRGLVLPHLVTPATPTWPHKVTGSRKIYWPRCIIQTQQWIAAVYWCFLVLILHFIYWSRAAVTNYGNSLYAEDFIRVGPCHYWFYVTTKTSSLAKKCQLTLQMWLDTTTTLCHVFIQWKLNNLQAKHFFLQCVTKAKEITRIERGYIDCAHTLKKQKNDLNYTERRFSKK